MKSNQQIYITYKGERKTISEWSNAMGVSWLALYQRVVRRGWPVTKAMETPFQKSVKSPKPAKVINTIEYTDEHDMENA